MDKQFVGYYSSGVFRPMWSNVVLVAVAGIIAVVITGCTDVPVDNGTANVIVDEEANRAGNERDTIETIPAHIRPVPVRAVVHLTIERPAGSRMRDTIYLDIQDHLTVRVDTFLNGHVKAISLFFGNTWIPFDNVVNRSRLRSILVNVPRTEIDTSSGTGSRKLVGVPYSTDGGVQLFFWVNNQQVELVTGEKVRVNGNDEESVAAFNIVRIDPRRRRVDAVIEGMFWNKQDNQPIAAVALNSLKLSFGY